MINKTSVSREEKNIEWFYGITLSNLANYYQKVSSQKLAEDFLKDIFEPMLANNATSGDDYLEYYKTEPNNQLSSMLIACAYCIQAKVAISTGKREQAWSYMADARYWCGVMLASTGLESAREKTIVATRKNTASKGGVTRSDKKYKEIKDEAFRLAKDTCHKSKERLSRRAVALTIKPEVFSFSIDKVGELSLDQAFDTIYGWLKQMPEASSLFKPRKNK